MVSDHIHLVRLCFGYELGEPTRVEEASRRDHQRFRSLVGFVNDLVQVDHICGILICTDPSPNSTATEFVSCNETMVSSQNTCTKGTA